MKSIKVQGLIDDYSAGAFTEFELFSWVFDLLPEVDVQDFYDTLPSELKEDFFAWVSDFEAHKTAFAPRKGQESAEKVERVVDWIRTERARRRSRQ
jgi:hypothetical protein